MMHEIATILFFLNLTFLIQLFSSSVIKLFPFSFSVSPDSCGFHDNASV